MNVFLIDCVFEVVCFIIVVEINSLFKIVFEILLFKGILGYEECFLVFIDYKDDFWFFIIDVFLIMVVDEI